MTVLPNSWCTSWIISILRCLSLTASLLPYLYISCAFATLNLLQALLKFAIFTFVEIPSGNIWCRKYFFTKVKSTWFLLFFTSSSSVIFYVVVNYDNINSDFVQPHENFRIQFRIQCGIHYNALHFKGVIIYRRSHNLPTNNDFPSHYLPENFDWEVINRYTGLFPLKFAILLLWKSVLVYALSQSVRTKPIRYLKSRWNVTRPRTSSNFCYDVFFRGTFDLKIQTNLKEPFLWRSVTTLVSH